jgi:hypothetical protein
VRNYHSHPPQVNLFRKFLDKKKMGPDLLIFRA